MIGLAIVLLPVFDASLSFLKQKMIALLKRGMLSSFLLDFMQIRNKRLLLTDGGKLVDDLFELLVIFGEPHEGLEDGGCILFFRFQRYLIVRVKKLIFKDKFLSFCPFLQSSIVLLNQRYLQGVLFGSISLVELEIIKYFFGLGVEEPSLKFTSFCVVAQYRTIVFHFCGQQSALGFEN